MEGVLLSLPRHRNGQGGGLFTTFCGKLFDPLVVKDSFLRGSARFSPKVAKRTLLEMGCPVPSIPPGGRSHKYVVDSGPL